MMFGNRNQWMLFLLFVLMTCSACTFRSSVDRADRLFQVERTEQEETLWLEEVRSSDGVNTIGYLEKIQMPSEQGHEPSRVYYVYGEGYGENIKGMILENGIAYRHTGNGNLRRVGIGDIPEGVKRILSHSGSIQFYRNGKRQYHGSEE